MILNRESHAGSLYAFFMHFVSTALLVFTIATPAEAETLRCGSSLVSEGETKADVLMKCGEPASRESRQEETVERLDAETKRIVTTVIDEWTYDFGPNSLIRILEFRSGKLTDIREGTYGGARHSVAAGCEGATPDRGSTRAEVSAQCGDPSWKEERQEETVSTADPDAKKRVLVTIEEWTYNLGPNRFIRIFEFRNGKLADIRTGGYGR
ncbi:MAG: hypothetical protein A2010_00030 [Nitrospirae bacterium GWD2_57_9]|nr:MAG: hypothetical protein A2010_00030 [Nitrospirae bacterium GWD2_57_9]OGW45129.1 MAG: hypothetical protein A2078_03625 [Nitrospirae bacterium GWC2_57_9]